MPTNVGQLAEKMGNTVLEAIRRLLDHQRLAWLVAEALIKTHPFRVRAQEILSQKLVVDIQTTGEDELWSVAIPGDSSFYVVVNWSKSEYHIHDSCATCRWCSYGTFQICEVAGQESVSFIPKQETTG